MNNQPAASQARVAGGGSVVNLFRDPPPDNPVPLDRLPGMTGSLISVARNQAIFQDGGETVWFYKIVTGAVRTCKFLADGRRQIDGFHRGGDLLGLEFGGAHRFRAEAVCDGKLIAYRYRLLETLAGKDAAIAPQLALHAMQIALRARRRAALLARRGAVEKLAIFLVHWADRSPGATLTALPMPRQDIGDYLGLTMESVSRAMTELEARGLIALPNARSLRIIDRPALRAYES